MELDVYGPSLPPQFRDAQSEHGSDPDHHSDISEQVCSSRAKKHSDKRKHKVWAKYISQSSSSEEDQSSVHKKRSSQPHRAPSELDQPQHDPDPLFYREVAMADLPSQYPEKVETLDLPDSRETMPRSSTSVLGLDDQKGQQELRPRGPSAILLSSHIKDAFDKFEQDFLASNLPEGKYIKPPPTTAKWYKVGQPCFEDEIQELNTDFSIICISPKPSGSRMGKVPLPVLKELEHQAIQNLSTINFTAAFAKTSSCNTDMEKCQHSLKSTFNMVKTQIQKGANPEKAAIRGYDTACDYFEVLNKTILIQQRTLACPSKSLADILQRELYTMGNTGLLRCEAEMTLLQPHLGDTRCQELRNSPFWPSSLFKSQLVKDREDFLLKKGTSKDSQGFGPYQTKPFRGPHNKKRGSYRKRPNRDNSSQSSNQ